MSPWFYLVLGLIIGWVVEWIIDWRFWRRPAPAAGPDPALQARLQTAEAERNELKSRLTVALNRVAPDDLEKITGIGPAYARVLQQAGVRTFAELSQLSPDRLRQIISPKEWQKIEPEVWIEEARTFARKTDGE
jgi:large subunit ribosomal protein L21